MHPISLPPLLLSLRSTLITFLASLLLCGSFSHDANAQRRRRRLPPPTTTPTSAPVAADASEKALARVPSPREVLGFMPGDDRKVAGWKQITGYFSRLDEASDRVQVQEIGTSTLGRPLIVAFISAPENIRELPKYKDIQRRLADPRLNPPDGQFNFSGKLVDSGKTVVAISCSIHSTEIVASQMSMQLAYEFASAHDADTLETLRNTILLLIPSPNPDGVDIVSDWYQKTLGTPYEGTEPPEIYHHYAGHDDNRDWFMLNLTETRAVTRLLWKEWFPQIVYDVHQQGQNGSRFFVPPFFDPPNPHIAPVLLRQVGLLGHKIAADLQAEGQQGILTNGVYDTWWHGGFRTAPYFHNSIGILTEAASAKLMTPATVTREQLARASTRGLPSALQSATNFPDPWPGGAWHPRDIMHMEMSASRSILSMAAKYREHYLRDFYALGRRAVAGTGEFADNATAYVIPAGQGKDENVAKMIGALVEQGVEVYRLDKELHVEMLTARGTIYNDLAQNSTETPAGSYIIFLAQPYRANVQTLFEKQIYPERRTAGGEAERPYDVAGWTLPMQMGVQAFPVHSIREKENERHLTLLHDETEVRRDFGLISGVKEAHWVDRPHAVAAYKDISPIRNPITRPVRLALYKSWTASMDEGWTRYVFDTFNVPYTSLLDADVRAGNLRAKYDVIVLPSVRLKEIVEGRSKDSAPAEFTGGITEAGVENLRRFVEDGGTLVCWDDSTELAIKRFKLPLKNVLEEVKTSVFYCPGSVLRIEVDNTDPLARGMARDVDAYFINSAAFEVTDKERVRVVARYPEKKEDILRSGWLLGPQYLAGKAALVEVGMGKGRVILFGFRPQHRAQTWGTFPFVFNSIMRGSVDATNAHLRTP